MGYKSDKLTIAGIDERKLEKLKHYRLFPSGRFLILFLVFLGIAGMTATQSSLSFALVCMVNRSALHQEENSGNSQRLTFGHSLTFSLAQQRMRSNNERREEHQGEFSWSKAVQSNLLAAFSWSGIVVAIPSGWVTTRYGSKWPFAIAVTLNAATTVAIPFVAYISHTAMFWVLAVNGASLTLAWPTVFAFVERWAGRRERSTFVSLATCGTQLATLLVAPISGVLCESIGWPVLFYICAGLSAVAIPPWLLFFANDPGESRLIGRRELAFLTANRPTAAPPTTTKTAALPVPWLRVMFSTPSMALYFSYGCNCWLFVFLAQFLPQYNADVLRMQPQNNGLTASLPAVSQTVAVLCCGFLADRLRFGGRSPTFGVKFFNVCCMLVPCVGWLLLSFLDIGQPALATGCLCLCSFCYSLMTASVLRSSVLIAPNFAGLLNSVANWYCMLAYVATPYVVAAIVPRGTVTEWRTTLYVNLAISAVGWLVFQLFGSGEEQSWNWPKVAVDAKDKTDNGCKF